MPTKTTQTAADVLDQTRPLPQGHIAGVPYDLRRPTVQKLKARWWNKDHARFLTPKTYGAGWDFNLYWVAHPTTYFKERQSASTG